ncbi:hypothetical protein Tco_0307736 [Tanacetum coccineum]
MDWYCKRQGITHLTLQDLEGPAFEIVKVFHPDVIHLQFQMEEFHKLLTNQVDDTILRYNVSKPLPLGGEQAIPALSISKMKAAYYPDVGLEQLVPDQFWIEAECKYDIAAMYGISHWWFQRQRFYIDRFSSEGDRRAVRTHMRILSVVRIEVFSMYGYNYMKKIVLRRADLKEYVIAERDFKYMYPSDFEDLYLLNLQGHLNHLSPEDKKILTTAVNLWTRNLVIRQRVEDFQLGIENSPRAIIFRDKYEVQMIMRFNEIHKFSDGTLQQIDEALDYRKQGLHVRYSETTKDKTYLPESGKLCWWTDSRRRLPEILLKMNLPDHRIKHRWRWRHLVPVESIHHPMLTLNVSKLRFEDFQRHPSAVPIYPTTLLDKADFASWQTCIRCTTVGKELKVHQFGPQTTRVYSDLSQDEKDRYNADIGATNIILQGLPKDIYSLINHYTDAKDIWDNVKMLLEGSELTKEDRESQLYDDFEHFRQNKGETIHDYYVRFAKLINDMRNIKMTMSKIQLNSKFVNNMLPEWGRFVTAVKLNKGLKDSNFDQLYAYLKQHEAHANENKMMLERLTQQTVDPLALMSNGRSHEVLHSTQALQELRNFKRQDVDNASLREWRQRFNPLTLNVDNVFHADNCDAYDSDVDEAPTAQTLFMANLSSADLVYDEAGPSYDSDVYLSNMTPYDQYVKDNAVPVVQNNASMVPNDAYVMIDNDLHESNVLSVSHTHRNTVVNNSLNAEHATYKEQVELNTRPLKALTVYPPNTLHSCSQSASTKRKHDEIERKTSIEHDNIIAYGLSKRVFYVASNSELNVSRFTEMQKTHDVVKARCLELEAELANLRDDVRKDNYNELLNRIRSLHQPWRSFAAIINKCLSGKPSYDSLRLSQAQILWGMYNNKKVDYAYLLWEDFIYQIKNKNTKKGNAIYCLRFTKLVIHFVMDKDPSIPRRNKVNWHYARDDPMFTTINVISRNEDTQLYGTILPVALTNEDIRNSESYKEYYAIASGKIPPKIKGSKKKADTDATTKQKPPTVPKEKKEKKSGKGKQKAKELETISEAVLTEAEQLKIITKRSRKETHSSHASGSGADEGTGVTPGVPDAPDYDSEDDISWKSSDDAQDDEDEDKNDVNETTQDDEDDDVHDDDENAQDDDDEEHTESEDDGDDFIHPKLTTHDDEIIHEEETDEDDTFDPIVHTPSHISSSDDEDSDNDVEGTNVEGAKSDEDATYEEDQGNEAVEDTNTNLEGRDDVMTDVILPQVQATQEIEDTHVTLTPVNPDGQQQSSSVSSGFVSNMLNPNQDTGVDDIFEQHAEATSLTMAEIDSKEAQKKFKGFGVFALGLSSHNKATLVFISKTAAQAAVQRPSAIIELFVSPLGHLVLVFI